jgi:hypothetical protein
MLVPHHSPDKQNQIDTILSRSSTLISLCKNSLSGLAQMRDLSLPPAGHSAAALNQ